MGAQLPHRRPAVAGANHLGVRPAEVGGAHPHPAVGQLGAQDLRERLRPGLGGAVRGQHRRRADGREGGDLEEVAAGAQEGRQEGPCGHRAADQVDLDDAAPDGRVGVEEGAARHHPGVGDDDGGRAEAALHEGGGAVHGVLVGDVHRPVLGVPRQAGRDPLQRVLLQPEQGHVGSPPYE